MSSLVGFVKKFVIYLRDTDNFLATVKLMFHHLGVWPKFSGSTILPTSPLFQKCCPWFVLVVSAYFTLISSPMAIYIRRHEEIAECLEPVAFAFLTSMLFVHFSCLLFRGERFERAFDTLQEMRACGDKFSERPPEMEARAKRYTDLALAYWLQCAGGGLINMPLTYSALLYNREFLFGSWYPYQAEQSPYFELTTIVWFLYLPIGIGVMNLNNALIMYFFSLAIAQIRILRFTLENVGPLSMVAVDKLMTADGVIVDGKDKEFFLKARLWGEPSDWSQRRACFRDMQLRKEMERIIKQCVVHQQIINRFIQDISSVFGPILMHQLNCCLIPTAVSIILIVFATEINAKTFLFFVMTIVAFINLFLFCWLAQEVTAESALVGQSAFYCDWLEASNSFKKSMLVMMTRSNQPLEVSVADFIPLNVNLCIDMIKMTYSYYMSAGKIMEMKL